MGTVLRPAPYDPANNPYPKMVYPGEPKPGTGIVVNSKEEHDEWLAKQKPAENKLVSAAVSVKAPTADTADEDADDKEALLNTAIGLGIQVDRRWGVERLKAAIAEKQAE